MSKIVLLNESCVDQTVDAIVNAANPLLWPGDGVCGEIFKRANTLDLVICCSKYDTPLRNSRPLRRRSKIPAEYSS